jgi:hypothetical protein
MSYTPDPQRAFDTSLRQARLVAFACCFMAPATYVVSFASQVLRGQWRLYLDGFSRLPWSDPRVPGCLALSLGALALALLLPPRLGRASLAALRGRNLLGCALLVSSAASGLFLGTRIGPPAASLCLCLFLAPMAGGLLLFPTGRRWRAVLAA